MNNRCYTYIPVIAIVAGTSLYAWDGGPELNLDTYASGTNYLGAKEANKSTESGYEGDVVNLLSLGGSGNIVIYANNGNFGDNVWIKLNNDTPASKTGGTVTINAGSNAGNVAGNINLWLDGYQYDASTTTIVGSGNGVGHSVGSELSAGNINIELTNGSVVNTITGVQTGGMVYGDVHVSLTGGSSTKSYIYGTNATAGVKGDVVINIEGTDAQNPANIGGPVYGANVGGSVGGGIDGSISMSLKDVVMTNNSAIAGSNVTNGTHFTGGNVLVEMTNVMTTGAITGTTVSSGSNITDGNVVVSVVDSTVGAVRGTASGNTGTSAVGGKLAINVANSTTGAITATGAVATTGENSVGEGISVNISNSTIKGAISGGGASISSGGINIVLDKTEAVVVSTPAGASGYSTARLTTGQAVTGTVSTNVIGDVAVEVKNGSWTGAITGASGASTVVNGNVSVSLSDSKAANERYDYTDDVDQYKFTQTGAAVIGSNGTVNGNVGVSISNSIAGNVTGALNVNKVDGIADSGNVYLSIIDSILGTTTLYTDGGTDAFTGGTVIGATGNVEGNINVLLSGVNTNQIRGGTVYGHNGAGKTVGGDVTVSILGNSLVGSVVGVNNNTANVEGNVIINAVDSITGAITATSSSAGGSSVISGGVEINLENAFTGALQIGAAQIGAGAVVNVINSTVTGNIGTATLAASPIISGGTLSYNFYGNSNVTGTIYGGYRTSPEDGGYTQFADVNFNSFSGSFSAVLGTAASSIGTLSISEDSTLNLARSAATTHYVDTVNIMGNLIVSANSATATTTQFKKANNTGGADIAGSGNIITNANNAASVVEFSGDTAVYTGNVFVQSGIFSAAGDAKFNFSTVNVASDAIFRIKNTAGTSSSWNEWASSLVLTGGGILQTNGNYNHFTLTGDMSGFGGVYNVAGNTTLSLEGKYASFIGKSGTGTLYLEGGTFDGGESLVVSSSGGTTVMASNQIIDGDRIYMASGSGEAIGLSNTSINGNLEMIFSGMGGSVAASGSGSSINGNVAVYVVAQDGGDTAVKGITGSQNGNVINGQLQINVNGTERNDIISGHLTPVNGGIVGYSNANEAGDGVVDSSFDAITVTINGGNIKQGVRANSGSMQSRIYGNIVYNINSGAIGIGTGYSADPLVFMASGYYASKGNASSDVYGNVDINIGRQGGSDSDVYIAGYMIGNGTGTVHGDINFNFNSGTVDRIFTGGSYGSVVEGDTNLVVGSGARVSSYVIGGGSNSNANFSCDVYGSTNVTVNGYVGGIYGSHYSSAGGMGMVGKDVNIVVDGGTVGSGGIKAAIGDIGGDVNLIVSNGAVIDGNVYAGPVDGGVSVGKVAGDVTLFIEGGTFNGDVYVGAKTAEESENQGGVNSIGGTATVIFSGDLSEVVFGDGAVLYAGEAEQGTAIRFSHANGLFSTIAKGFDQMLISDYSFVELGNSLEEGCNFTIDQTSRVNFIGEQTIYFGDIVLDGEFSFSHSGTNNFKQAVMRTLSGNGSILFNVNIPAMTGDHLTITDSISGTHTILVDGRPWGAPDNFNRTLALITTEGFISDADAFRLPVNLEGRELVDIGSYSFVLRQGDGSELSPNANEWYLVGDGLSKSAEAIIGTAAGTGLAWHMEMDTVLKRMGDIRSSMNNLKTRGESSKWESWVRTYGLELNAGAKITGSSYKEYYYGADLGFDRSFRITGDIYRGYLFTGVFAGMGWADRQFNGFGKGDTDTTRTGIYGTYISEKGWYHDFVGKFNYYEQRFNSTNTYGNKSHGSYNQKGVGFSYEFGRHFATETNYFIEPQLQMSYGRIWGASYTTTGDVPVGVKLDDLDTWQLRSGVRAGKHYGLQRGSLTPYLKASAVGVFNDGGRVSTNDGLNANSTLDGARMELGAGLIWDTAKTGQYYLDYEYIKGRRFNIPWRVNLGYRVQF